MADTVAQTAASPKDPSGKESAKFRLKVTNRKLPRPIVFWSDNEKDAFRRNRVVQTRLNMVIDDIANQRDTMRKTMRYEAHKFRLKNQRYYQHPAEKEAGFQSTVGHQANSPFLQTRKAFVDNAKRDEDSSSDEESTEQVLDDCRVPHRGIITRAKKPVVKFSMYKETYREVESSEPVFRRREAEHCSRKDQQFRSMSAVLNRETPYLQGTEPKRQASAFPAIRTSVYDNDSIVSATADSAPCSAVDQGTKRSLRSETFFDKSKAAFQLRQSLRQMARLRKRGVTSTPFTHEDALKLEREKYGRNTDRVVAYIERLDAERRSQDRILVNRWTGI